MTELIVYIWIGCMLTISAVGMYKDYSMVGAQFLMMLLGVLSISISSIVYS